MTRSPGSSPRIWGLKSAKVLNILHKLGEHLKPSTDILTQQLRASQAVNSDETGWWFLGEFGWAWSFSDPRTCIYRIENNRGHRVVLDILGPDFAGHLKRSSKAQGGSGSSLLRQAPSEAPQARPGLSCGSISDPAVDATNNRAERDIRPFVIFRKVCGGARSACGPRDLHG